MSNDLHLLPNLERENDRFRGADLHLTNTDPSDFATLPAITSLKQALMLRFLTPHGALAHLGHPDYGTKLSKLQGRPNNAATQNAARLFTIETLTIPQDDRISRIDRIDVRTAATDRGKLEIDVQVRSADGVEISLTVPVELY